MFDVNQSPDDLLSVDRDSALPLAVQLHQQISWLIASRIIEEGQTLPPIRALADRVGVNLHTVRAAYQDLERDGLVQMQRGRGTTVLPADKWRTSGRATGPPTSTIGVIIPTHASPFYAPFLSGVEAGTRGSPLAFVCDAHENPERGLRYLDQLISKRVDGVIVAGPMIPPEVTAQRARVHPPVVCADYPTATGPRVEFDLEAAGREATAHLIEHGHRRIGLISPPVVLDNVRPRVDAYRRTLDEAGLSRGDELIAQVGDWSLDAGARGMKALLERDPRPTAVVTVSGALAVGALTVARGRGVVVPRDLAMVSMDDAASNQLAHPPLTSIDLSPYDLGRLAAEMLGTLTSGAPLEEEQEVLPVELVIRDSCGSHR